MKPAKPPSSTLWHRLLDHYHQDPSSDTPEPADLTADQQAILQAFTQTVATGWKERYLVMFLQEADWNPTQALQDLEAYQEANYGLLAPPPPPTDTTTLQGFENDQGTSCYLDALLFAMYLGMTSFDPMLLGDPFEPVTSVSCPSTPLSPQQTPQKHNRHRHHRFFSRAYYRHRYRHKRISPSRSSDSNKAALQIDTTLPTDDDENDTENDMTKKKAGLALQRKHHLQRTLRLVINKLRQGQLIKQATVAHIRQDLHQNGWYGQDPVTKQWQQEDVSELFLFLTSIFDSPYLPFQLRLFHGANTDLDDDRIMTDRLLPLSLPSQKNDDATNEPIRLETILVDHFYNSVVTGVKRHFDTTDNQTEVDAWQAMELLPFYSSSSNDEGALAAGYYAETPLVLPLVLKRYQVMADGAAYRTVKDCRAVVVPASIPFNQFVNKNSDHARCALCHGLFESVLVLKSVVCHHGASPQSGHYTAYASITTGHWLKFDDMDVAQRVHSEVSMDQVLADVSNHGYLFFYELNRLCASCVEDSTKDGDDLLTAMTSDLSLVDQDDTSAHDDKSTHDDEPAQDDEPAKDDGPSKDDEPVQEETSREVQQQDHQLTQDEPSPQDT